MSSRLHGCGVHTCYLASSNPRVRLLTCCCLCGGILVYIIGSVLTQRKPYNLDRLLHRGEYDVANEYKPPFKWTLHNALQQLVGRPRSIVIGDKVIAWSVVTYAIIYELGLCFVGVLIWNMILPWSSSQWSNYFLITSLWGTGILGIVSTVWFFLGGIIDIRKLFRDLAARIDDPLNNGMVGGHVSLVDQAAFEARKAEHPEEE
ncbi:hypothetical protein SH580_00160 [Coraliomargarita algicola]|uniref:Uncharacterized protein n=1 Tax=Coraliomargarita algicola TaxID=3092156 RepID=A0ABZ0RLT1_9BACT|nr:hypothetical protein [Coraliomargarita sp. J2-16]WPJ96111.1 hypothetical protein SH580_00160 [Coraliomargarita sp. J2-16]